MHSSSLFCSLAKNKNLYTISEELSAADEELSKVKLHYKQLYINSSDKIGSIHKLHIDISTLATFIPILMPYSGLLWLDTKHEDFTIEATGALNHSLHFST